MATDPIIKLFDFNVLTDADADADADADDDNKEKSMAGFTVQMFGIDADGGQVAVEATGFRPFFYAKVSDQWTSGDKSVFTDFIRHKMGRLGGALVDTRTISKKVLYGFDNDKNHKFVVLTFANMDAFNRAKNLWYSGTWEANNRRLTPGGLYVPGCGAALLYEANIPPLVRFFHLHDISPSGWVKIPRKRSREVSKNIRRTTCAREFVIPCRYIEPLNDLEQNAPYLKMSFDIEASSSHGDFPVPIKTYKKLATNIVDMLEKAKPTSDAECEQLLRRSIQVAFGHSGSDEVLVNDVDQVFPQKPVSLAEVQNKTDCLVADSTTHIEDNTRFTQESIVEEMFERRDAKTGKIGASAGDEEDSGGTTEEVLEEMTEDVREVSSLFSTMYGKSRTTAKAGGSGGARGAQGTIVPLLRRNDLDREARLTELIVKLRKYFPKLEGDKVTFIGSTFMRQGAKEPYMNHCIVLDTCELPEAVSSNSNSSSSSSNSTKTVIETYATEREVLLAWTRLMQVESPDMVMGYNIFGFDYEFMFRRAQELDCVEEFLKLSKNRNEICGNISRETGEVDIDRSVTTLASGTYELAIVKMAGRLQVDMLGWFRKNDNLTSYKLDDVAGHFIGDDVKRYDVEDGSDIALTRVYTGNMTGLHVDTFVHFDEITHSTSAYQNGAKFRVVQIHADGFTIAGAARPKGARVRWGLSKDDVTPKDIFRLTREGPRSRGIVAKYCIQDCNLVHYLLNKTDVTTSLVEMARLCIVPMSFLIFRGQGIKLTSFVAKKCRDFGVLMPVVERGGADEAYEGAIVLSPNCGLYLKEAVGIGDFGSLYPSSMLSENLCPRSKVWTKTYDLEGNSLSESGIRDKETGNFKYDNLPGRTYVDRDFDTYKWIKPRPSAAVMKVKTGRRVCRFVQPLPNGDGLSIMPSILKELLSARKATRRQIPATDDEFTKNVLDKRQLAYKVTANSLYGQMGAKTSTFYEPDIAAATTSTGRMLLTYAKRVIEECYANQEVTMKDGRRLHVKAECVYGDTDSVFFKFNFVDVETGKKIEDRESLVYTMELSQTATQLVTKFLKAPHDFEYEKTFMPFCLLAKKRYVAIKYELDPNKGKRNEMGIVLKRRDNAPIVKDVYGGAIDILMKEQDIGKARDFVVDAVKNLLSGKVDMNKLVISKSLRGFYANPQSIAHNVLASRIGERDPGNKPRPGDRIAYAYFVPPHKDALQKDRIELPQYIRDKGLSIDYAYYIHKQLMNPISQLFGLVVDELCAPPKSNSATSAAAAVTGKPVVYNPLKKSSSIVSKYRPTLDAMHKKIKAAQQTVANDTKKLDERIGKARAVAVAEILFGDLMREYNRNVAGLQDIGKFCNKPMASSSSSSSSSFSAASSSSSTSSASSPTPTSKSASARRDTSIANVAACMASVSPSYPSHKSHKLSPPPSPICKLSLPESPITSSSPSPTPMLLPANIHEMKCKDLMNLCRTRGLAKSGNKKDLIARLCAKC